MGASGDLAPLAHIALGLTGEGRMWSPESGWSDASLVLASHGIEPLVLLPKEGKYTFVVDEKIQWYSIEIQWYSIAGLWCRT